MSHRFEIVSIAPNGRKTRRKADTVVEAWDWYAYFTSSAPLNEVLIFDHDADVEARST